LQGKVKCSLVPQVVDFKVGNKNRNVVFKQKSFESFFSNEFGIQAEHCGLIQAKPTDFSSRQWFILSWQCIPWGPGFGWKIGCQSCQTTDLQVNFWKQNV
jgi:hypothetical protein